MEKDSKVSSDAIMQQPYSTAMHASLHPFSDDDGVYIMTSVKKPFYQLMHNRRDDAFSSAFFGRETYFLIALFILMLIALIA
jgi:hypothetical protein